MVAQEMNKIDIFNKSQQLNTKKFNFKTGDTVKVNQKIKDGEKERIQTFEGLVIARKHGVKPDATFIVRKISFGIGVERVFPLYSPLIAGIEVVKSAKVRRSKIYFIRTAKGKKSKLKSGKSLALVVTGADTIAVAEESAEEQIAEEKEMSGTKTE